LYKYFFLILLCLSVPAYTQINDSVRIIIPVDTLHTDTMSVADSVAIADTFGLLGPQRIIIADTIRPIYQRPLYGYSRFINQREFTRRQYNYAGDIFKLMPFFFDVSPGLAGHPSNMLIYGTGASLTSFLINGINYNDYSDIPFDLNRIQEEYIDSAEVLPLPRSFLYGLSNNSSAINIIGMDFISVTPFTKIKYSEGPYGDGNFDGMFNSILTGNMNLFVEVTNRKTDIRFVNTDYGKWNGRLQLKYLLNNNVNLLAGYHYSNTYTGAAGGINITELGLQNEFYEDLYNEISADVIYRDIRFNTYTNSVFLKTLSSVRNFSFTDFTLYYRFNRIEINQPVTVENHLDNLFRNKIAGVSLNQHFNYSIINMNLLGNYENIIIDNYQGFSLNRNYNNLSAANISAAGILTITLLDSLLHPSVFYKLSKDGIYSSEIFSGYGTDLSARLTRFVNLYAGYSQSENRFTSGYLNNFQTGIRYINTGFYTGLSLFSRKGSLNYNIADTIINVNKPFYYRNNMEGISLDMNIIISRIQLEGKIDYYTDNNSYIIPAIFAAGGIYYRDSLFKGNLDIKAGVDVFYYGRRNIQISPQQFSIFRSTSIGPDVRLDLFISGDIQNTAIIFFTWENLLDTRYFLIPFYPMPPRGVRFGVNWQLFN
jgi:hypothetical protein